MSEATSYLEKIHQKIVSLKTEIKKNQMGANAIAALEGIPEPYPNIGEDDGVVVTTFGKDDFYGQPMATCVRRILEARKVTKAGPATVNDIHAALIDGGYAFDTKDDLTARNSLRVGLTKNPQFHKLPSGLWGLLAWYPKARTKTVTSGKNEQDEADAEDVTEPEAVNSEAKGDGVKEGGEDA